MDVVVVGGTGMIGRIIVEKLLAAGDDVWVSSRRSAPGRGFPKDIRFVRWDTESPPDWDESFDAVVNVAGESLIEGYWTERRKEELWRSRAGVNAHLAQWIRSTPRPPKVFVTASAVGYYGPYPAGSVTEDHPPGDDLIARMCRAWEEEAFRAESERTRVVATRFGILLDPKDGALAKMVPLWKLFLGGSVGAGHQPFPWIASEDAARIVVEAVHDDQMRGGINAVAPERVTNKEFTRALGRALHRPAPWMVPPVALRILYGDGAQLLEHGQGAVPARLQERGFRFRYPELQPTLERLVDGH